VEIRRNGETVGEGTKTVTHDADGTTTTVTEITYEDGSTKKTTTVTDADGNVVSEKTDETDADGNATTTEGGSDDDDEEEYCAETQDTCGVTSVRLGSGDLPRSSHRDQISHPTNDPDGGRFGGDVDGDGKPEVIAGRLSGVTDPSPDGPLASADGSGAPSRPFNGAGPEFGPDGPQTPDTSAGPQDPGNGPISLFP